MALTLSEKSDCRRHLGYPVAGLVQTSPSGNTFASGSIGYRFTQAYGFLEYKLNNLNPDEEARVTGKAYGAIAFLGVQPQTGDTASVTLSGGPLNSPVTIEIVAPAPVNGVDGRLVMANLMASAAANNTTLQAAGFIAVAPYGTGPFAQTVIPIPECAFMCPQTFTIACSGSGNLVPQLTANGAQLNPVAQLDGCKDLYGYIPILNGLESAHANSSQNLDTAKADVWTARSNEAGSRASLLTNWRGMFSDFLGTPLNPEKFNNMKRNGALRFA